MRNRTVLIVLLIAGVLLAFIVLIDQRNVTTDELERRKDHVFSRYRNGAVDKVVLTNEQGTTIEIERTATLEQGDEKWQIVRPGKYNADEAEIHALLSAFDFLLKERVIRDDMSKAQYGLESPRISGAFYGNGKKTEFYIGGEDPSKKNVYVSLGDIPDEFYAVHNEFFEAVNKTVNDLRDTHLVSTSLTEAVSMTILQPDGKMGFERDPQNFTWSIADKGAPILAAFSEVSELLHGVGDLKAVSFVSDEISSLTPWGLDKPKYSVEISLSDKTTVRVLVGDSCKEAPNSVYVSVAQGNGVQCVSDGFVGLLDKSPTRYMENHPVAFSVDDVDAIRLERDQKVLHLEKNPEQHWSVAGSTTKETDQVAVIQLVERFSKTAANRIVVNSDEIVSSSPLLGRIVFTLDSGRVPTTLTFFSAPSSLVEGSDEQDTSEEVFVRRNNESILLAMPADMLEVVTPSPLGFRPKVIENGDVSDVFQITVDSPVSQSLVLADGKWNMVSPVSVGADTSAVTSLCTLLAQTPVERFAAAESTDAHGFAKPWATVTGTLTKHEHTEHAEHQTESEQVVLEIGAETKDGMRYARFKGNDSVVFTIAPSYWSLLEQPLVARDLLRISSSAINRVAMETPDKTVTAILSGEEWTSKQRPIDSVTLKRLIIDLGAVKTVRAVQFGKGLGEPILTLKLYSSESDEPATLVIGEKSSRPQDKGYLVRREGLDVTFVMPARLVEELIAFVTQG